MQEREDRRRGDAWGREVNDADFNARLQLALVEQQELLRADPKRNLSDPTLPVSRLFGELDIEQDRQKFEAGDKWALLAAVRECARCSIPMPDWLATAFILAYDGVLNCRIGSWDEAFGRPFPKGTHLAAKRKRRTKAPAVWLAVRKATDAGEPLDEGLFERVGKKLGLGKTQTAEFYYSQKAFWETAISPEIAALLEPHRVPQESKKLRNYKKG